MNIKRITTGLLAALMLAAAVAMPADNAPAFVKGTDITASAVSLSERDVRSKLYIVCKDGRKVYVAGGKGSMFSTSGIVLKNYGVAANEVVALQLEASLEDLPDNCDATLNIGGNYSIYNSSGGNYFSSYARGSAQIPGSKKFYNVMLTINDTDVAKIDFLAEYRNLTVEQGKIDISNAKVKGIARTYNGKAQDTQTNVTLDGKTLMAGVDYNFRFSNNTEPGFAKIIVTGIGDYEGTATGTFEICPKQVKVKKAVSTAKKTVKLTWKKSTHCTGFQIVMATSANYKSGKKVVYVKKNTSAAKTIKNLKSGKKYYIRIRAYKKVGKQKIYGRYSKSLTVKCK